MNAGVFALWVTGMRLWKRLTICPRRDQRARANQGPVATAPPPRTNPKRARVFLELP